MRIRSRTSSSQKLESFNSQFNSQKRESYIRRFRSRLRPHRQCLVGCLHPQPNLIPVGVVCQREGVPLALCERVPLAADGDLQLAEEALD